MNPHQKMIAAAQRAARKIARAEGLPYQGVLDRVARDAGRRHWQDFCSDPVPVDAQSMQAAGEPDFSRAEASLHLDMCISYGREVGATGMLAWPLEDGRPALSYLSPDHLEGRRIDARGLSLKAMATALAHVSSPNGMGVYSTSHGDLPFRTTSIVTKEGRMPFLTMSLDGRNLDPHQSLSATADQPSATDQPTPDGDAPATLFGIDVHMTRYDDYTRIDGLVDAVLRLPGSHVLVTPRKSRYDVHLVHEGRERLVHHGEISGYHSICTVTKDRAQIDVMEERTHQEGIFVDRSGGEHRPVYVQFEARTSGPQTIRLGLERHPRLAPIERPQPTDPGSEDGMLVGRRGLLRRPVRVLPGRAILVSGHPGSGKTRDVLVPAIIDADQVDVVVQDHGGRIMPLIGDRLARSSVLVLDPRGAGPRFNPLHRDMMPDGHLEAAEAISDVLYPKRRSDGEYWESGASRLFSGMVDVLVMAPGLVTSADGRPKDPSLPAVALALRMVDMGHLLSRDSLDAMISSGAHHGFEVCRDLLDKAGDTRLSIVRAAQRGLAFLDDRENSGWTNPKEGDDGASLARILAQDAPPATVVVRSDQTGKGGDVLSSLVIDAAVRLREAQGVDARHMHVHLDEFVRMAPMGWTDRILSRSGGTPARISAMMTCQALSQIDRVSPMQRAGAISWFDHVVVTAYSDMSERWRLMRDFPGMAGVTKMAVRIPKNRHQLLSRGEVETLRT